MAPAARRDAAQVTERMLGARRAARVPVALSSYRSTRTELPWLAYRDM